MSVVAGVMVMAAVVGVDAGVLAEMAVARTAALNASTRARSFEMAAGSESRSASIMSCGFSGGAVSAGLASVSSGVSDGVACTLFFLRAARVETDGGYDRFL